MYVIYVYVYICVIYVYIYVSNMCMSYIHIFTYWLCCVLVAAHGVFNLCCSMWGLFSCSTWNIMWVLVP